jgi:hypothetical protein
LLLSGAQVLPVQSVDAAVKMLLVDLAHPMTMWKTPRKDENINTMSIKKELLEL